MIMKTDFTATIDLFDTSRENGELKIQVRIKFKLGSVKKTYYKWITL